MCSRRRMSLIRLPVGGTDHSSKNKKKRTTNHTAIDTTNDATSNWREKAWKTFDARNDWKRSLLQRLQRSYVFGCMGVWDGLLADCDCPHSNIKAKPGWSHHKMIRQAFLPNPGIIPMPQPPLYFKARKKKNGKAACEH